MTLPYLYVIALSSSLTRVAGALLSACPAHAAGRMLPAPSHRPVCCMLIVCPSWARDVRCFVSPQRRNEERKQRRWG